MKTYWICPKCGQEYMIEYDPANKRTLDPIESVPLVAVEVMSRRVYKNEKKDLIPFDWIVEIKAECPCLQRNGYKLCSSIQLMPFWKENNQNV